MKKFLSLLCMITCIFGLTACGETEELTAHEQGKIDTAIMVATEYVIPSYESFKEEATVEAFKEYTAEEVEYMLQNDLGINANGYAYRTGIESFNSAYEKIGNLVSIGEATAEIDDKQIIVLVEVQGEKDTAEAEIVFTNDMFMKMESAALNPVEGMSELMVKAAQNTLIGMGTVFSVLLLICAIISCFNIIPKIQAKMSKADKEEVAKPAKVQTPAAPVVAAQPVAENLANDLELVAVISAAIAASEGATTTDGFVVRSIRRVRR